MKGFDPEFVNLKDFILKIHYRGFPVAMKANDLQMLAGCTNHSTEGPVYVLISLGLRIVRESGY